jgi:hypothetical protein
VSVDLSFTYIQQPPSQLHMEGQQLHSMNPGQEHVDSLGYGTNHSNNGNTLPTWHISGPNDSYAPTCSGTEFSVSVPTASENTNPPLSLPTNMSAMSQPNLATRGAEHWSHTLRGPTGPSRASFNTTRSTLELSFSLQLRTLEGFRVRGSQLKVSALLATNALLSQGRSRSAPLWTCSPG